MYKRQELHPAGPKSDYAYHTEAMDRAMEADAGQDNGQNRCPG